MLRSENKGELVGILCTAPMVKKLVKELVENAFLTTAQAQVVFRKLAESSRSAEAAVRILFSQPVADYVLKSTPDLAKSLEQMENGIKLVMKVDNALKEVPKSLFSDNPFVDEFVIDLSSEPVAQVSSSAAISKSFLDLDKAKAVSLSAIPLVAALALGATSNKAAKVFVKPEDNKFAVGVGNGVVDMIISPLVAFAVSNSLVTYAGGAPIAAAASIAAVPTGSALVALAFAGFCLKGLSYSVVRHAGLWAKSAREDRDRAEQGQDRDPSYRVSK